MSDEFNTNQQFNDQTVPEFTLPEVIVTAPRATSYDWYSIWNNIFARIAPQNPVFINPIMTQQNRIDGYMLRRNRLGTGFWRVTASGRVHPDDIKQCDRQEEIFQDSFIEYAKLVTIPGSSEKELWFNEVVVEADRDDNTVYFKKVPDYTTVNYKGKTYNIYVPWSGTDMNSGGWRNVDTYNTTFGDFSFSKFVSGFAVEDSEVKPIIEAGDKIVYRHRPNAEGVGMVSKWALGLATGESLAKALQIIPIQVIKQEKDNESRIIIQVGLNSNYFQKNAGKTVMPSATGYEGALNVLTGNRTFRLTLDSPHANDPFTAFISINKYGEFVVHPKVYSGDRLEVGHSGFWGASDFQEIPMSPTIISKDGSYKSLAEKLEEIFSR
ncbi:hypothetical protein [Sporomusa sp. GT1]|uniref:hypothetical protein n=1 Tax=Sporomusa TaxID=2375 RepID=UPI00166F325E|nr:hypothetical protein [Sporomusa sp. GT1]